MGENDLISRAALEKALNDLMIRRGVKSWRDTEFDASDFEDLIDEAPAVDAEPVRHGRWIPEKVCSVETKFKCSECNRKIIACNDYFGRAPKFVSNIYPYCHCGAKMDGEIECSDG